MAFSKNRRLADLVSSAGEVSSFVDASVTHADLHTSMDLTGKTVTVANASTGDSDTTAANTAFVQQEIAALVDSAPGTLNTLNELAAALGDDASFSTTVTNSIATKLPLAGGSMTGDLTVVDSGGLGIQTSGYSLLSAANNARPASGSIRLGNGAGSTGLVIDYTDQGQTVATIRNVYVASTDSELTIQSPFITFDTGTSYTERMRITSAGNVGIGTSSPVGTASNYNSAALHIHQSQSGSYGSQLHLTNAATGSAAGNGAHISMWSDDDLYITNQESDGMIKLASGGNADALVLNDSGKVGIGTASPTESIHINKTDGTGAFIRFQNTGGSGVYIGGRSEVMEMYTNGSEKMRILADGKVGIGDNSPTRELSLKKTSDHSIMAITTSTSTLAGIVMGDTSADDQGGILYNNSGDYLYLRAGGGDKMRINSTGEVGIGTTPATHYTGYEALDIGDTLSLFSNNTSTNISTLTNNGYLNSGASNWVRKYQDESTMYSQVHGDHRFSTAASGSAGGAISWGERVRIQAAGGISFNGDTAAANALDDYEEGEVSYYGGGAPRWYGSAGAFENTGQLGGNKVFYTKIGNMVHLHGQVSWTNTGAHGNNIRIDLPFSVVSGYRGALALGLIAGLNTGSTGFVTLVTETGSTVAYLLEISSGSGHSHTDAVDLTGNSYRVISFAGSYTTSS